MLREGALTGNLAGIACENRRHEQGRDIDGCKHEPMIIRMA